MKLSDTDLQRLCSLLQSACDNPVFLFDYEFHYLTGTQPQLRSHAESLIKLDANSPKSSPYHLFTCALKSIPEIHVLILGSCHAAVYAYIRKMLEIFFDLKPNIQQDHSRMRRILLLNRLCNAFSSTSDNETKELLTILGYRASVPRFAVLLDFTADLFSENSEHAINSYEQILDHTLCSSDYYSDQDIYGPLNEEHYLILKDLSVFSDTSPEKMQSSDAVHSYLSELLSALTNIKSVHHFLTVGSCWLNLKDIKHSYNEAQFLLVNRSYFSPKSSGPVFIHNYLFEYLSCFLPENYWKSCFSNLDCMISKKPELLQTVTALSFNNMNLRQAAASLGIHRNTLLQRFDKIKELTSADPVSSNQDRMLLHTFSLFAERHITLHAGIVIQPGSVLHQGMQHLAQLISEYTHGKIVLHIHTLSLSGNNAYLFDLIRTGSIDLCVAATSVMNSFTDNQSQILDYPFLFHSSAEANYILNQKLLPEFDACLSKIHVKCLSIWSMGWRYINSGTPIHSPLDIKQKRIRIMFNDIMEAYYLSLGAFPVKMNYGDVNDAIEMGIIDCEENPYSNILGMNFYKKLKYITRLKYFLSTEGVFLSEQFFQKLGAGQQSALLAAVKETTDWVFQRQQTVINQKCKQTLLEKNVQLINPTKKEISEWKRFSQNLFSRYPHTEILELISKAKDEYHAAAIRNANIM